jgi:uncharacterized protein YjbI with pentapeptide repeats
MADEEDLRRLRAGEKDHVRADFRNADISNLDASRCDFSQAKFKGTIAHNTNFAKSKFGGLVVISLDATGANLEGATFHHSPLNNVNFHKANLRAASFERSVLSRVNLSSADIRGANFRFVNLQDGNDFSDARFDESTDFDKAYGSRSLQKLPLFAGYDFAQGQFHRKKEQIVIPPHGEPPSSTAEKATEPTAERLARVQKIVQRISEEPAHVRDAAADLSQVLQDHLEILDSSKPNEPAELQRHNEFRSFLSMTRQALELVVQALDQAGTAQDKSARDGHVAAAAGVVAKLHDATTNWLTTNAEKTVGYVFEAGLLGAGCWFLTACGAPTWGAFPAVIALLERKSIIDTIERFKGIWTKPNAGG